MTDRYTISSGFSEASRDVIAKALKMSKLPEGVSVVCWNESENAQKPFVVIVHSTQWEDAVKAFKNGAIDYVPFSVDPASLAEKLNEKR